MHSWRTIVATVREHLVQQGELPPTSKLAAVSTDSVLSLDPRRPLPSVDSRECDRSCVHGRRATIDPLPFAEIELDEIELFLTRLWEREPHRYRRYIIVHDRAGPGPLESKCMERGVSRSFPAPPYAVS